MTNFKPNKLKIITMISPFIYPLFDRDCQSPVTGGAELQLYFLAKAFESLGHEVHVITGEFGQGDNVIIDNIYFHKVQLKYMGGANYHLPASWLKLLWCLFKIKSDVHLLKLPRSILLPVGVYSWLTKKKLIFIGQIDYDVDLKHLRSRDGFIAYWLYRVGMIFVNHCVAQNKYQATGFKNIFSKPTAIIRNTIKESAHLNSDKKGIILWVGRNQHKKRPDMFLSLAKKMPRYKFHMIMAPSNQSDADFVTADKELDNFKYFGYVPPHQINKHFAEAEVLVLTSIKEGFPNVFLQAWACKCAVVSLSIDPDNVIVENNLGYISGTLENMAEHITALMENKALCQELGENGYQYIKKNHSIDTILKEYVKIL